MRNIMRIYDDEAVRKACFEGIEKLAVKNIAELIELVNLRNQYARACGFEDFYAYKLYNSEGMTKRELFALTDEIYERTKYVFDEVRDMERNRPGIRKPWNMSYMLAADFEKKEDQYLQFSDALMRWGRSFERLGIGFKDAILQLDLRDRKGKYGNGFCHWPGLVHFKDGRRVPGRCNFSCNMVLGQVGAGAGALYTLFHEGGHAAHLTNVETTEACMNQEYPPTSIAWAETHSMFLETMQKSIEWLTRYAKNNSGEYYPFSLFEEKLRHTDFLAPLYFLRILMVVDFERELYETPDLTESKVLDMALSAHRKHTDMEADSAFALIVPHLYGELVCTYHAYGLALLALYQWREYFHKKYGFIVDNPEVGREMRAVWELGASKTFAEFVEIATGKKLSAEAYISEVTRPIEEKLSLSRKRIERLKSLLMQSEPVDLDATIRIVDGKELIADNSLGFEKMAEDHRRWVLLKEGEEK